MAGGWIRLAGQRRGRRASPGEVLKGAAAMGLLTLSACGGGPSLEQLRAVEYTPLPTDRWEVSTPGAQELDSLLVARLYHDAAQLETSYGLLVFRNGYLVAEDYFGPGSVDQRVNIQSVTKSVTSALAGIALERGCIASLDQPVMDFFPELDDRVTDPRKRAITVRHLLQMRAGFPWEESSPELTRLLFTGFRPATLLEVPLVRDPGTGFEYSNLTSHLLGIVVARACHQDLKSFAQAHLFGPMGIELGKWRQDWEGYYLGYTELELSAREMAAFGTLYRNDGRHRGRRLLPAGWVDESWRIYSQNAWPIGVGRNWQDNGYGFQWWSVRAGSHRYHLAWGHGGEQIAILAELDLVVVLTVDPLYGQLGGGPWKKEKANLNLVADFIASLPAAGAHR